MTIKKMNKIKEIDGHTIEVCYSGSGSIDPWSGEYARELGVALWGTSDIRYFALVDGSRIYRIQDNYTQFIEALDGISFEELEKLLSTQDNFGTLEERKKDIDRLKIESDMVKKMTPEEKRAYFEEKRRKRLKINY